MNKKISLLVLSAFLSTSIISSVAFAEGNTVPSKDNEPSIVIADDENQNNIYSEETNEVNDDIEYNLDEVRDENLNYKIPYDYLKEYYNEYDLYLYKGQDFVPTFILKNSNINSLLNSKDKSFVLDFSINGESFDESSSILTGASKEFYNTYSNQIYRWVSYKSNLGNETFKDSNTVSFPLESKDLKVGDTVYLYSTSNLKEGKIVLVGEKELDKEDILEGMSYGQVTFDTNLDVSDRAFFLTTSKIDIVSTVDIVSTEKSSSSNKISIEIFLAGTLIIVVTGGYILLKKKTNRKTN